MYSNCVTPGYEYYHMKKYEGADNLVAEIRFSAEPMDEENPQAGVKYVLNGKEISYEEYAAFCSKVFAAEESTTVTDVWIRVCQIESDEKDGAESVLVCFQPFVYDSE